MSVGKRIARKSAPRVAVQHFTVGKTVTYGPNELLAMGMITPAEHAELLAQADRPKATLVVKSVDRKRGIVTYGAAT